jgi:uncharacterized membrane protein YdjX (TVP38/TMEM64 family)
MSEKKALVQSKTLLIGVAVVGVVALVALGLLLRVMSVQELLALGHRSVDRVQAWSRTVGPFPFFAAMALLPAAGFPIMVFSLSAGVLFAPQIGLGWVIVCVVLSLGVNIALTYWLARYALRPLLEGLVRRLGYALPKVAKEDYLSLTLICRITPGPPFFVQNYLLGLAGIPFWTYLWVSWLISAMYSVAMVVFGDSLMQGSGKVIFLAVSIFVALTVGIKWVRRRYAQKKVEVGAL